MSLSAALEEFYASGGEDEVAVIAIEILHPGFEPIRWVSRLEAQDGAENETIILPLIEGGTIEQGTKVPFQLCAFHLLAPGSDKDGPTDGKLRLDGVSGQLQAPLKAAQGFGEPIRVTFRTYLVSSPAELATVTGPDELLEGLELSNVAITSDMAEGSLTYSDGRNAAVPTGPNAFFDRGNYPALFR